MLALSSKKYLFFILVITFLIKFKKSSLFADLRMMCTFNTPIKEQIPAAPGGPKMGGGSASHKYKKYKQKYLNLKYKV